MPRASRQPLLTCCFLVLLLLAGCGIKAPPRPRADPATPTAQPTKVAARSLKPALPVVDEVRGYGRDGALALAWKVTRTPGAPPTRYEVQRRRSAAEATARTPARFQTVRAVDPEAPAGARLTRDEIEVLDFDLAPGEQYEYRVVPLAADGRPGQGSPALRVDWRTPPPPPRDLAARPGNQIAELSWAPSNAADVVGYQVFRGLAGEELGLRPLNRQPLDGTSFVDLGLANNREYQYEIRAVVAAGDLLLEGPPSARASVIPRDLDPPPPPQGLRATATPKGVRLDWKRVKAQDLGGYKVYRRGAGISEYHCLTAEPTAATRYLDREADPSGTWSYVVTAVDRSPARNESGHSREATFNEAPPEP